mgnify:CR=1 FL=1
MLLDPSGKSLIEAPLTERRAALEAFFASAKRESALKLSPYSLSLAEARRWLRQGGTALDGVVAKLRDGPYVPGERAMMKVKQHRTADCVVGGFRYRAGSQEVGLSAARALRRRTASSIMSASPRPSPTRTARR